MEIDLRGRTALVTGAGRNLGRAIALACAEAGANVVVNVRANRDEAEAVAREARERGVGAMVAVADVGDPAAVGAMAQAALARFGAVDVLVNNAAIRPRQAFLDIEPEDWDRVLRTNLTGPYLCARALVPAMAERRYGRIINISGVDGQKGAANRAHNVACKAGLLGLTRALAIEFGRSGVTVNAVVPGAFDTSRDPAHYPAWPPAPSFFAQLPVPRLGEPWEVGQLCAFLASPAAGYITGQSIHVNGGLLMW